MRDDSSPDAELLALRERAKELRCLYEVISALGRRDEPPQKVFAKVLAAIPPAWQYPDDTTARIEFLGRTHALPDYVETPWRLRSAISIWRTHVGAIEVFYKSSHETAWEGPFLKEERQLLDNIAQRIAEYVEWKQRELGGERVGAPPDHWKWRQRFAERIAASLDPERFGVEKVYLHGSTEEGSAGAGSDIDLLVVVRGGETERKELLVWLEGWSLCLAEMSFQMYGLPSAGLLDVRLVEADAWPAESRALSANGTPPRELPLGTRASPRQPGV